MEEHQIKKYIQRHQKCQQHNILVTVLMIEYYVRVSMVSWISNHYTFSGYICCLYGIYGTYMNSLISTSSSYVFIYYTELKFLRTCQPRFDIISNHLRLLCVDEI